MSIKHIEDLSYSDFVKIIDLPWYCSEKIDGSSVEFGLDQDLMYYMKYGKDTFYKIDDIPYEIWSSSYRLAFIVGSLIMDVIKNSRCKIPGYYIIAELIFNNRPNTIYYDCPDTVVILSSGIKGSNLLDSPVIDQLRFKNLEVSYRVLTSDDGKNIQEKIITSNVAIKNNPSLFLLNRMLSPSTSHVLKKLKDWLSSPSSYENMTVQEVIAWPLTKKPPLFSKEEWSTEKQSFKKERDRYRELLDSSRIKIKNFILDLLSDTKSSFGSDIIEGIVVVTDHVTFKIVNKHEFTKINFYLHRMKYLLLGSAFYKKKGLLQIYKNHSMEEKLYQLDRLLDWYLKHRYSMRIFLNSRKPIMLFGYTDQVHQRVINMFADTRSRIKNGRHGI